MKTAVFLQARLGSSRLPAKVLYELGGKPVLLHCMQALSALDCDEKVLLCDHDSKPAFESLARFAGWKIFAGSTLNVLSRFVDAAFAFEVDYIVRATADNPLLDSIHAQNALQVALSAQVDHACYTGMPLGSGVEIVSTQALKQVFASSPDDYETEHVCPGVYHSPGRFKLLQLAYAGPSFDPSLRLTLDTFDDYCFLKRFFETYYRGTALPIDQVIDYARQIHQGASYV